MKKWGNYKFFHLLNSLREKYIEVIKMRPATDSVGIYFLYEKTIVLYRWYIQVNCSYGSIIVVLTLLGPICKRFSF